VARFRMHLRNELTIMMENASTEIIVQQHNRTPSQESNSGYSYTSDASGEHIMEDS
jgi:hypothetical protein